MKNILTILILGILFLGSCKKENEVLPTTKPQELSIIGNWKVQHSMYNYFVAKVSFTKDTSIRFIPENGIIFGSSNKGTYIYSTYKIKSDSIEFHTFKIEKISDSTTTESVNYTETKIIDQKSSNYLVIGNELLFK